jgi:hypothetical protein
MTSRSGAFLGGDLEGRLSVIANVPQTVVTRVLERLRTRFGFEAITMCLAAALLLQSVASAQMGQSAFGNHVIGASLMSPACDVILWQPRCNMPHSTTRQARRA